MTNLQEKFLTKYVAHLNGLVVDLCWPQKMVFNSPPDTSSFPKLFTLHTLSWMFQSECFKKVKELWYLLLPELICLCLWKSKCFRPRFPFQTVGPCWTSKIAFSIVRVKKLLNDLGKASKSRFYFSHRIGGLSFSGHDKKIQTFNMYCS